MECEKKPHGSPASQALKGTLLQDIGYGVRTLVRNPGFTIITLLTLALGIGANSAMFSVLQGVVLSPLPFPESNRLVFLWQSRPGVPEIDVSEPNFEDWQRNSRSFEQMSALEFNNFTLSYPGAAEHLLGMRVSSTFLATLKVMPVLGHDFTPDDDRPNRPPVALMSYRLWKERFSGDPQAIGRTLVLDGKTFTIFGVLPPRFQFLADADVITPLRPQMPAIYADRSVQRAACLVHRRSASS